ncbi:MULTISPECIES: CdaR family transcriptional regulator [Amycolatopsis]|uniref:PucR family transcriptional regulator n=1 Tax=Amycolatopsis TaxID=1813 RepID=UPI00106E39A4|nr:MULTISPECIES: PucR family transcriptional regulator [Amycolatopsis]MCG3752684.1 helix-turn-helix domain-containing protein [Amycolatopsis sp. Poz14]
MVEYRSFALLASLPRALGACLRPHAAHAAAAMIQETQRAVPAYGQPLKGVFGKVLVRSVEYAVLHCVDSMGAPDLPHEQWIAFYRARGAMEFSEGRNLDALQDTATIGARVAWRAMHPAVVAAGVDPAVISVGAEAIFAYVDELCATAIAGYQQAQTDAEGAVPARRRRLLELIVQAPEGAASSIAELANGAGWPLPETAAMVALERGPEAGDFPAELLGGGVLADLDGPEPHLLAVDPDADLAPLAAMPGGWRAAVSPTVPLADAPAALRTARRALQLSGPETPGPVIWCRDHLATLWLLAEDFLAAELARQSLDPFASLSAKQRDRLSETLLAWLETRGGAPEIAQRLGVHPQTVRNRLRQLEELFGDRLKDADDRLGMQLALRAQRLMRAHRPTDN